MGFYPTEYSGVVRNGELVYYEARPGYDIDPSAMSTEPPEGEYEMLDSLGGRKASTSQRFSRWICPSLAWMSPCI